MAIIQRLACLLAAVLLNPLIPNAGASTPREQLAGIRLGGLHLAMTQADFDAMVRANPTWNEPNTDSDRADCTDLGLGDRDNPGPYFIKNIRTIDSRGRHYSVSFVLEGTGMVADRIYYAERLPSASWERRLADAERRFGEADWVGFDGSEHQALWCSAGDEKCTKGKRWDTTGPSLSLTFYPHQDGELEAGDRLDYEILRGSDAQDAAETAWDDALDQAGPRKRAALLARCRKAPGGFASEDAIKRYYASLIPLERTTSHVIDAPLAVPPGVFAAIGINAAKTFAKGVCFNSTDVFFEDGDCPGGQVSTGFRWARKTGDIWLLSMLHGGVSLRRPYFAVRETAPGRYRKVWWILDPLPSEGVASFNSWRAKGGLPMVEPPSRENDIRVYLPVQS